MPENFLTAEAAFAAGGVILVIGAIAVLTSSNAVKRVGALALLMLGALIAASAFKPNADLLIAGVALTAAQLILGAAIVVRLQESYDGVETPDIDAADAQKQAGTDA